MDNGLRAKTLTDASRSIETGDILLFRRGGGLFDRLLSVAGRSPYVHVGMAVWLNNDARPVPSITGSATLCLVDVLQWHGGRVVTLESEVARYPGQYDLFSISRRFDRDFDRLAASRRMMKYSASRYGWWNVFRVSLRHMAFVRLLFPPLVDDKANGTFPPFCSQAVAHSCRKYGGIDPVPNLADRVTEPGDIARSLLFEYQFTLPGGTTQ